MNQWEMPLFFLPIFVEVKGEGIDSKIYSKKSHAWHSPPEVVDRPKKGFGVPIAKWVKGPLRELFQDLLSPEKIKREGFLNPEYVENLLGDHLRNKVDHRKKLWTLLVWELWADCYRPTI